MRPTSALTSRKESLHRQRSIGVVDYGKTLMAARMERQITVTSMAACGWRSRACVNDIEAGSSTPNLSTAERLANLAGHTLAWMTLDNGKY